MVALGRSLEDSQAVGEFDVLAFASRTNTI
jgi:hypothetical protein